MYRAHVNTRGLTLIEVLIVLMIIGILAAVIIPRVNDAREKGRIAAAQVELDSLQSAMEILNQDTGLYPNGVGSVCRTSPPADNEVDLSADSAGLVANGNGWSGWNGPYVSDITDPWGTPYFLDEDYRCLASTTGCRGQTDSTNDSSVIVSCGPNAAIANNACDYDGDNIVYLLCD